MSPRRTHLPPYLARAGLGLLFALVVVAAPRAVELDDLYSAEVPAPQASGATDDALASALQQVLVKASGQTDVAGSPAVREAMRRPGELVLSYGMVSRADPAGGPPRSLLAARFDSRAVDRLLRAAGLPVWGRVRPTVLAWVAVQAGERRGLLGAGEAPEAASVVRSAAARRGVPLTLPLLAYAFTALGEEIVRSLFGSGAVIAFGKREPILN